MTLALSMQPTLAKQALGRRHVWKDWDDLMLGEFPVPALGVHKQISYHKQGSLEIDHEKQGCLMLCLANLGGPGTVGFT